MKEDVAQIGANYGGLDDGLCVQVLQGGRAVAGYLFWCFSERKDILAAVSASPVYWM